MPDFDPDAFAERAAIREFCGGMSRFRAETEAAAEQHTTRWEALRHEANGIRNPARAGHHGSVPDGQSAHDLPAMQRRSEEENRPMPERDVHTGWGGLDVLALRMERGALV